MKQSKEIKNAIITVLATSAERKSKILSELQDTFPETNEKIIKRALKKLIKRGKIEKEGKLYRKTAIESGSSSNVTKKEQNTEKVESVSQEVVTAAELIKRRRQAVDSPDTRTKISDVARPNDGEVDIDEEIRRLEAELGNDDSDESESEVSEQDEDMEEAVAGKKSVSFGTDTVVEIEGRRSREQPNGPSIVCLSTVAGERISPLPASCLPQNKKRSLKGIDRDATTANEKKPKRPKVNQGLEEAVNEVLGGYVARSSERLPYYCRVCSKQYSNENEFFQHKDGEFHKTAVQLERKASFCKLCRKQFTSPVQLKEHISSRPHKERLQMVRSRQAPRTKEFSRQKDRRTDMHTNRSSRQWR